MTETHKERIVFQPPLFRGYVTLRGVCMLTSFDSQLALILAKLGNFETSTRKDVANKFASKGELYGTVVGRPPFNIVQLLIGNIAQGMSFNSWMI